jgi:hypothetical protein
MSRTYRVVHIRKNSNQYRFNFNFRSSPKRHAQNAYLYPYLKLEYQDELDYNYRDRARHTSLTMKYYCSAWDDKIPSSLTDRWCEHKKKSYR